MSFALELCNPPPPQKKKKNLKGRKQIRKAIAFRKYVELCTYGPSLMSGGKRGNRFFSSRFFPHQQLGDNGEGEGKEKEEFDEGHTDGHVHRIRYSRRFRIFNLGF